VVVLSSLALLAWIAVLARGLWMITHPVRQPAPALAQS
jgi:hypothetical protein